MSLTLKYSAKPTSKNRIFLVGSKAGIKKLDLSSSLTSYFQGRFNDNNFAWVNEAGRITAIVKTEKLNNSNARDKTRDGAFDAYRHLRKLVNDIQIEGDSGQIELFAEGLGLSAYSFDKYLTDKKKVTFKKATTTNKNADLKSVNTSVEATNWARDLVNEPVSYLTAEQLAKEVKAKCTKAGLKVEVMKKAKIESLKMGGILAVNKGSLEPPTFTIIEWKPKKTINKKPIVLVGKGVVYDTGGLSLKPTMNSMDMMKCDMGGAATMAATIYATARLKLPLHLIALLPSTDNRPGGSAYAPGDIITMFDKTTVEVLNTDAEGRMILADALAYSNKYKPELVIDAATLTGSASRAIGYRASIAMGNAAKKELNLLEEAGEYTHDRVVQFPFWDEYLEDLKSPIADLKNIGGSSAGMITAGKFLEHFVDYPYIHIDIAGPAFNTRRRGYNGIGASGAGVRLLIEFLKRKAKG